MAVIDKPRAHDPSVQIEARTYYLYNHRESSQKWGWAVKPTRNLARESAGRYRVRMRAQGLRPIQIWVPDTRSPKFAAECRRQSELISQAPVEEINAFLEAAAQEVAGWQ